MSRLVADVLVGFKCLVWKDLSLAAKPKSKYSRRRLCTPLLFGTFTSPSRTDALFVQNTPWSTAYSWRTSLLSIFCNSFTMQVPQTKWDQTMAIFHQEGIEVDQSYNVLSKNIVSFVPSLCGRVAGQLPCQAGVVGCEG